MPTYNQRFVLNLVRVKGPISRADIVRLSGLTFPSVSRLVGELIERGLVAEKRQRRGGMGKPPTELELNPESAYSLGFGIDRDHLSAALVDLSGEVKGSFQRPLEDPSPDSVLPLMVGAAEEMLGEHKLPKELLLGAGVSLPLPLHAEAASSYRISGVFADELMAWQQPALLVSLSAQLGCPVLLENTAKAAAIGERWYGVGRDIDTFLLLFFAHGVGGGAILSGKPHLGFRGFAGEFGNLPIRSFEEGKPHHTGGYAAPGSLYAQLAASGTRADSDTLTARYAEGDESILGWLDTAALHLAPAIVYAECLLDPEAVVLGGRLPAALIDGLIERLREQMSPLRNESKPYEPQLLRGRTGEDAAALGAAALPIYRAMSPDPTPEGRHRGRSQPSLSAA